MSNEVQSSIQTIIDAYRERWRNPPKPGPLIVPDWLPAACALEGKDEAWLDQEARANGFDGFQPVSEAMG